MVQHFSDSVIWTLSPSGADARGVIPGVGPLQGVCPFNPQSVLTDTCFLKESNKNNHNNHNIFRSHFGPSPTALVGLVFRCASLGQGARHSIVFTVAICEVCCARFGMTGRAPNSIVSVLGSGTLAESEDSKNTHRLRPCFWSAEIEGISLGVQIKKLASMLAAITSRPLESRPVLFFQLWVRCFGAGCDAEG